MTESRTCRSQGHAGAGSEQQQGQVTTAGPPLTGEVSVYLPPPLPLPRLLTAAGTPRQSQGGGNQQRTQDAIVLYGMPWYCMYGTV